VTRKALAVLMLLAVMGLPTAAPADEEETPPARTEEDINLGLPDGAPRYTMPSPRYPEPRDMQLRYTDVAVLAGVLLLAAFVVLKLRHRGALTAITVFTILYFGFYRAGCVCPIGGIQNIVHSATDPAYTVSIVVTAMVLLPIIATLFFGRVFCGGACPLGAIQDIMLRKPVRVPRLLDKILRWGRWVYLALAVYFVIGGVVLFGRNLTVGKEYLICKYDPFINIFRTVNLSAVFAGDWTNMFRLVGPWWLWLITGGMLATGIFVGRPYCRWLCPYGAILGVCSRVAWKKVTVMPEECIDCELCSDACPFGAIENHAAHKAHCLACGRCYAECPKERQRHWQVAPAGAEPPPRPALAPAAAVERSPIRGRTLQIHDETPDLAWLDEYLASNDRDGDAALPILQAIQARHNYLPYPALVRVTKKTDISMARLIGLATFYNQFRLAPRGQHLLKICCGTACHVAGAQRIRDAVRLYLGIEGEADTDAARRFTVQEVACVGCCSLAPVIQIDDTTFGRLTPETAAKTVETFSPASHKRHAELPASHDPVLDDIHKIDGATVRIGGEMGRRGDGEKSKERAREREDATFSRDPKSSPSATTQGSASGQPEASPAAAPTDKGGSA
jgi:NADH:ubiquinone oxidoreductase subunit E/NAD-dependent dihydropyrimidine dehydrogenase PreA subunit